MLIKGEKYACQACVRGHRVTNCRHTDRPLLHINKKGRPAIQCPHCRPQCKPHRTHDRCSCDGEKASTSGASTINWGRANKTCCCSNIAGDVTPPKEESKLVTEPNLNDLLDGDHMPINKHCSIDHRCNPQYVVLNSLANHDLYPSGVTNQSSNSLTHSAIIDIVGSESNRRDSTAGTEEEQRIMMDDAQSTVLTSGLDLDPMYDGLPQINLSLFVQNGHSPQNQEETSFTPDHEQSMFTESLSSVSVNWFDYDGLDSNNEHFYDSIAPDSSFTNFDIGSIDPNILSGERLYQERPQSMDGTLKS